MLPNKQVKCAWIQEVWTKNKRDSTTINHLINEAKNDYSNNLIINSNTITNIGKLSELTGFSLVNYQNGQQFQFFSSHTKQLIKNGSTAQKLALPFQWIKDTSTNIISAPTRAYKQYGDTKHKITAINKIDLIDNFIEPFHQKNLFKRSVPEFNWICENSFIDNAKSNKKADKKYINYQYDDDQFVKHYVLKNDESSFDAYFILRCVTGQMTIPYLFVKGSVVKTVADFIWQQAIQQKVNSLTVYHQFIGEYIKNVKYPNLKSTAVRKNIYTTDELSIYFSEVVTFMDGDGDAAL